MATHTPKKKTGRLIHNNRDESLFVDDSGNSANISTLFDGCITRCNEGKSPKSIKDDLTNSKSVQNFCGSPSVSSRIIMPSPFSTNEANRKRNKTTNERSQTKDATKSTITERKDANGRIDGPLFKEIKKSTIPNFNNTSYFSEKTLSSVEQCKARVDSMIDLGKDEDILPGISFRQNVFSIRSPLNFNNMNSSLQKNPYDNAAKFEDDYGDILKELAKTSENERIFSLVPKISRSKPITLTKRKYSSGILSIRNSKGVLQWTEENDERNLNEITQKIEFNKKDVSSSSNSTEDRCCIGENKCLDNTQTRNDDDYLLSLTKPVRIKCIDETSSKIKDVIIYSNDFLRDILKEGGNPPSKKEIDERILKETTYYTGKTLRIITDAKKHFCNLYNSRKPRGNVKFATTKVPKNIPTKVSKRGIQLNKKSSNTLRCDKNRETFRPSDQAKKETIVEQSVPLKKDISNQTADIQPDVLNSTQSDRDSYLEKIQTAKSVQSLKRGYKEFGSGDERKSRTVLKTINIENIIASNFSYYFRFHAKLGFPLKSGASISKKSSTNWLRKSGVVFDNESKNTAEKCFRTMASTKYVLNVCDYIKYLNKIARNRRMLLVDILYQMMSVDLHTMKKFLVKQVENRRDEATTQDSTPKMKQAQNRKRV